jgi:hypothetical protein
MLNNITYKVSKNNIHIVDSYKINKSKDILAICKVLKAKYPQFKRNYTSWHREWCAHNFLYNLNIKTNRTKDVDLNENESMIRLIGYFLISLLYMQ